MSLVPLRTRHERGLTLVEVVMFIVIVGVIAVALVGAFGATLRPSHYGTQLTQATHVAQQRLEVILGRRRALGFAAFDATSYDPCDGVGPVWTGQVCQSGGYSVSSTLNDAADACEAGSGTNCKRVTVSVSGPGGDVLAVLVAHVWNY